MRWLVGAVMLIVQTGCHAYYLDVDGRIAERAAQAIDVQSAPAVERLPERAALGPPVEPTLMLAAAQDKQPAGKTMLERLTPGEKLLGFVVPDITMPPAGASQAEKDAALKKQFPPLPALPRLPEPAPGPEGRPLTLSDLQQIALQSSPLIRQAHLDIEAARGAALQAGLYPNPSIGYEGTTIGQGNENGQRSPGQQGGFIEQTIVTAGKLKIAQVAALREVQIHEQKLRQAEADVQAQVRAGYFAVLAAQKNFETMKALATLSDELYAVLLLQMQAGEVAAYEPMQIRVAALQSRGGLVQAHNRYVAAWKQLAAALGTPGLTLTALAGRIDMPAPHFEHDAVLDFVLAHHSEVIAAQFGVERARLLTRLAEVQPCPDLTLNVGFQKDYTAPPFGTVANVNVAMPIPFWNRNQGNIQQARAQYARALQENARVQNELTARVAGAFERYESNRVLLQLYKKDILPNQVQAFRASVARHALGDKGISYNDVVVAQQSLAVLINSYLGVLHEQWVAVVDIGQLLQTRDLFQLHPLDEVAPVPDACDVLTVNRLRRR